MSTALSCTHLCKSYDTTPILQDVILTIPSGRIVGLLGKNGAGKTTLLKLITGLLTPTSGEILVDGHPVGPDSKASVAFLSERTFLDKTMTVAESIQFFVDFFPDFDEKKARKLLKNLDLTETTKLSHLSKGMLEKVQLCLIMSRHAQLYILDEPLGGVDPATRDYILDTILTNFDKHSTMIISTHLISDIERILDDVIFIDGGRIHLTSSVKELKNSRKKSIDEIFREEFRTNAR